jgi:hypothetical protein
LKNWILFSVGVEWKLNFWKRLIFFCDIVFTAQTTVHLYGSWLFINQCSVNLKFYISTCVYDLDPNVQCFWKLHAVSSKDNSKIVKIRNDFLPSVSWFKYLTKLDFKELLVRANVIVQIRPKGGAVHPINSYVWNFLVNLLS